ncbi:hypothetical protein VIGAN_07201900, partial [Vigna angularis var. angularis]
PRNSYLDKENGFETITSSSRRVQNLQNDSRNVQNGHPEPQKLSKTKTKSIFPNTSRLGAKKGRPGVTFCEYLAPGRDSGAPGRDLMQNSADLMPELRFSNSNHFY